jgi:hypothetical protein
MGGDLPCRHGEAAFYLVSVAQHTGVSSRSSTVEGYVTVSSVSFGLFCPCEGITVNKFKGCWVCSGLLFSVPPLWCSLMRFCGALLCVSVIWSYICADSATWKSNAVMHILIKRGRWCAWCGFDSHISLQRSTPTLLANMGRQARLQLCTLEALRSCSSTLFFTILSSTKEVNMGEIQWKGILLVFCYTPRVF